MRRFSGYYLPTVLKLLRTYNEVALHAGESSVASGIQQEIGGILDTIDRAFVTPARWPFAGYGAERLGRDKRP